MMETTLAQLGQRVLAVMTNRQEKISNGQFALRVDETIIEIADKTIPLCLLTEDRSKGVLREIAKGYYIKLPPKMTEWDGKRYQPRCSATICFDEKLITALTYGVAMKYEPMNATQFARHYWEAINENNRAIISTAPFQAMLLRNRMKHETI